MPSQLVEDTVKKIKFAPVSSAGSALPDKLLNSAEQTYQKKANQPPTDTAPASQSKDTKAQSPSKRSNAKQSPVVGGVITVALRLGGSRVGAAPLRKEFSKRITLRAAMQQLLNEQAPAGETVRWDSVEIRAPGPKRHMTAASPEMDRSVQLSDYTTPLV